MKLRISTFVTGLICLLGVQGGVTAAATGSSGASANEAVRGKVGIELDGWRLGPHRASGRFTLTGAISDRGEFSERLGFVRVAPEAWHYQAIRTLVGSRGTIWTRAEWTGCVRCRGAHAWEITRGSGAYAGIGGRGRETRDIVFGRRVVISMRGTVSAPAAQSRLAADAAQASARIAFVRGKELYVMNADGSDQRPLAQNVQPVTPAWSPDAQAIAFVTNRDGNPEIYVVNADGTGQRNLTQNPTRDGAPVWSPGGRTIAFARWLDSEPEIFVTSIDGSGQRNLTQNPASDVHPVWSPDARRIAFVRKIGSPGRPRVGGPPGFQIHYSSYLYVVNADGSGLRRLTPDPVKGGTPLPVWSPDTRTMRFGRYVLNADGSGLRKLARDFPPQGVWSPDGRKIAFVRAFHRGTPVADYEIHVVNADGSGQRRLTRSPGADSRPVWSPDGRRIAFRSVRDGNPEIYVMNADGSGQRNLTRSPEADGWFAWSPSRTG
jgi:TolB protein